MHLFLHFCVPWVRVLFSNLFTFCHHFWAGNRFYGRKTISSCKRCKWLLGSLTLSQACKYHLIIEKQCLLWFCCFKNGDETHWKLSMLKKKFQQGSFSFVLNAQTLSVRYHCSYLHICWYLPKINNAKLLPGCFPTVFILAQHVKGKRFCSFF